jgi:hypothetical protein
MSLLTEGIWIALVEQKFQQFSGPYFEGGLQLQISPDMIWSTTKRGWRGKGLDIMLPFGTPKQNLHFQNTF